MKKQKPPRGVLRVQDLYSHSERRPGSTCWWWTGAAATHPGTVNRSPRIWTFDHARGDKRVLSGPQAVFNITHRAAPPEGHRAYMRCLNSMCVRPECVTSGTMLQIGAAIAASGKRKGTHVEARRACAALGRAKLAIVDTPADKVAAVLLAPASEQNQQIAERLGMTRQTVSRIRAGKSRRGAANDILREAA
jgi:hypothetical protein